jgi:DNA polymerase bacteriophage-type
MLLSYALDDAAPGCIDLTEGDPSEHLLELARQPDVLVWFQNGEKFDWPVCRHALPWLHAAVPYERRRDTMVQAYAHGLPGNLEMMCASLGVDNDKAKSKEGKRLIRLFCMPQKDGPRATRLTHPDEWAEFKAYAVQDIVAMRECHRKMPSWNYRGRQIELSAIDQRINDRGICMDLDLADAAIKASDVAKAQLAVRTRELTDGAVHAATQRDQLLAWVLAAHGVDLPDMTAPTIERRMRDENLPDELRELLAVRLESTTTSVAKYTTLRRGVSSDGRLRGSMQFRGAARTGRDAHRLFQPGNMPRPDMPAREIEWAIDLLKMDAVHLVYDNVMRVCSNAIRGTIVAGPGKKLVVADLANIEGRFAAWIAGEESELQAFRDYDAGTGPDLYIVAYANSFNVAPETIDKKTIEGNAKRQIGKVQSLMFAFAGGVGAWLTGAATYGIDLAAMTEQVWDTLPGWAVTEAKDFLDWLCKGKNEAQILKARMGLTERTFICCDAIKRLWRRAHPQISSMWKELEESVRLAIENPGATYDCRKLKVRRDGAWLRIALPSGRALCYPQPMWDGETTRPDGTKKQWPGFSYVGIDQYSRAWGRIGSYGGKLFENIVQAGSCDQLLECMPAIEDAGFGIVLRVHDEFVTEADADRDDLNPTLLGDLMCSSLGWNEGLPLAAAGFEGPRYKKGD